MPGVMSFGEIPLRYRLSSAGGFAVRLSSWFIPTVCFLAPAEIARPSSTNSSNLRFSLIQKSKSAHLTGVHYSDFTTANLASAINNSGPF